MQRVFVKLKIDISLMTEDGIQIWDKGEVFLLAPKCKKRHAKGMHPERLISTTDGSMIARTVIDKIELGERMVILEEAK